MMDHDRHQACAGSASAIAEPELVARMDGVPHWSLDAGALHRRVHFDTFATAVSFTTQLALLAERHNHHPAFTVDKRVVDVRLWTRKRAGITALDFELAEAIDALIG